MTANQRRATVGLLAGVLSVMLTMTTMRFILPPPAYADPPRVLNIAPASFTGGGEVWDAGRGQSFLLSVDLRCDNGEAGVRLSWLENGSVRTFRLDSIAVDPISRLPVLTCLDDPAIDAGFSASDFDTVVGLGSGRLDGGRSLDVWFEFTDAGEPGIRDFAHLTLAVPGTGSVFYEWQGFMEGATSSGLSSGNLQASGFLTP